MAGGRDESRCKGRIKRCRRYHKCGPIVRGWRTLKTGAEAGTIDGRRQRETMRRKTRTENNARCGRRGNAGKEGRKRTRQGGRRRVAEGWGERRGWGGLIGVGREESVPGSLWTEGSPRARRRRCNPGCDRNSNELLPRRAGSGRLLCASAAARDARTWPQQGRHALLESPQPSPAQLLCSPCPHPARTTPQPRLITRISSRPSERTPEHASQRQPSRASPLPFLPRRSHPSLCVLQPLYRPPRARSNPRATNVVFICPLPLQKRPRPSVRLSQSPPSSSALPLQPPSQLPAPAPPRHTQQPLRSVPFFARWLRRSIRFLFRSSLALLSGPRATAVAPSPEPVSRLLSSISTLCN